MTTEKKQEIAKRRVEAVTLAGTLDEMVTAGSQAYLAASSGGMADTISMAVAVAEIEHALSSDIMKPIMSLQGKSIGFKTDKTYSEAIVKEAMVEALMIGVPMAGNCMNIIAGRCYVTKEGFTYKIKQLEQSGAVKGFVFELYPPEKKEGRTVVKATGKWTDVDGPKVVVREFPIRTNGGSTDDNTLGKAERKIKKACYEMISGVSLPDGDADGQSVKVAKGIDIVRDDELAERKPEAFEILIGLDIIAVKKAFDVHGYGGTSTDDNEWIDQALAAVMSIEKLDNIIENAKKLND